MCGEKSLDWFSVFAWEMSKFDTFLDKTADPTLKDLDLFTDPHA